jgi:hypothetical protein
MIEAKAALEYGGRSEEGHAFYLTSLIIGAASEFFLTYN